MTVPTVVVTRASPSRYWISSRSRPPPADHRSTVASAPAAGRAVGGPFGDPALDGGPEVRVGGEVAGGDGVERRPDRSLLHCRLLPTLHPVLRPPPARPVS